MNNFCKQTFFENGWGVSIVSHRGSYGGEKGLFEVAVLDHKKNFRYDSGVTQDVIGWLDFADVAKVIEEVKALPKCPPTPVYT